MSQMIGKNDDSFNELILKFYNIKEELNLTFNNITQLAEELESCYMCESGKDILCKFHTLINNNYSIVLDNFDSYITDLKMARDNMDMFDKKLSEQIFEETANIS